MRVRVRLAAVFVAALPVDEQRKDRGEEEEEDVHDAKGEAGLEHGAVLVDVQGPAAAQAAAPGAEDAEVDVEAAGGEVATVRPGDLAQHDDAGDETPHEAKVHKGHEDGRVLRSVVREHGRDRPDRRQHRRDEEDEDEVGRQGVG